MEKELFIQQIVPLREKLLRYAQQYLKGEAEAEDVVQEVFIKLWSMGNSLHEYENKSALSYRMTKNLCINRLKSSQYNQMGLDDVILNSVGMPDSELESREEVTLVMTIIDRLPDMQQTILKMRHVEGLEVQEIVELTGGSAESIRMNLSRGRKKVRDLFLQIENHGTNK